MYSGGDLHKSSFVADVANDPCMGLERRCHRSGCCAGGRTLYAGTESGCIRCYRLPLTGEFQEYRCFSTAVLRLCTGSEGTLLFATSADGAITTFDAKERDPMRMPRRSFPGSIVSGTDS